VTKGLLTPLQQDVMQLFFGAVPGFVLTGGAALAGFYTQHRTTTDLDLFCFDDASFAHAASTLTALCGKQLWSCAVRTTSPSFVRLAIARPDELLLVDLVRDHSPQCGAPPIVVDGIRVDALAQIFVNKLTALVGREELRDVVDVMALEQRGFAIEDHLASALDKDGGCTPATLAWLLAGWAARVPADADVFGHRGDVVAAYMKDVAVRMRARAHPGA
jgi:hypothetical protein